jgi:hypothetical protein
MSILSLTRNNLKNHALYNNYYVYGIETTYVNFIMQQRKRHDCQDFQAILG